MMTNRTLSLPAGRQGERGGLKLSRTLYISRPQKGVWGMNAGGGLALWKSCLRKRIML